MSRWMETAKDGTGKTVYIETLKDEKAVAMR